MLARETYRKLIMGLMILTPPTLLVPPSYAEENSGPKISGFVDTTYVYSFDRPTSGALALRSFDARDNNIALNAAQVAISGSLSEEAGYMVKMLAGSDAAIITPTGSGTADDFDIQEAYLTHKCRITSINLKVGKFVTTEGIEVIESKDNPTISRGYLFGLAEPYTHVGALALASLGKFELGLGVVNGWDITTDNNQGKTLLGKIGLNLGDPLSFSISGTHGSEQASRQAVNLPATAFNETLNNDGHNRSSIDLAGVTKIIPKVALWFQANKGEEEAVVLNSSNGNLEMATWGGFGVQPVVSLNDWFSIGGRFEYFDDTDGARTGTPNLTTKNYTVTPTIKCSDNVTLRAEYRYDTANKKLWVDDNGTTQDNSSSAGLEFILTF